MVGAASWGRGERGKGPGWFFGEGRRPHPTQCTCFLTFGPRGLNLVFKCMGLVFRFMGPVSICLGLGFRAIDTV